MNFDRNQIWMDLSEVAQLIRNELDKRFTGHKFTVKSSRRYREISIEWMNGPSRPKIQGLLNVYFKDQFILFRDGTVIDPVDINAYPADIPKIAVNVRQSYIHLSTDRIYTKSFVEEIIDEFQEKYDYIAVNPYIKKDGYYEKIREGPLCSIEKFISNKTGEEIYSYWGMNGGGVDKVKAELLNEQYKKLMYMWRDFVGYYSQKFENPVIDFFEPLT